MKRFLLLSSLLISTVILGGWLYILNPSPKEHVPELIRFHVRANSDNEADQALKLKVRDAILAKFSPVLAKSVSLDASRELVKKNLPAMEQEANRVISSEGKEYSARAVYGYANFPVKSYGSFTLPAGRYEAVQILIGEGKGANWWCVLFPPLCFVDISNSVAHEPSVVVTTTPVVKPNPIVVNMEETKARENTIQSIDTRGIYKEDIKIQEEKKEEAKEDGAIRSVPQVKFKAVEVVKQWLHWTD